MPILASDWGGLSHHLIAAIQPIAMDKSGKSRSFSFVGDTIVAAPITDASHEQSINWQSPFEGQTPDAGLGTFGSMLQVGGYLPILNALQKRTGPGQSADALAATAAGASGLIGASSVTKMNATQVFSGAPPLTLSLTAHFRAFANPKTEVEDPVNQLIKWQLPRKLAEDGVLTNLAEWDAGLIRSVFPSLAPTIVALRYGGVLWAPMVIERVSRPITVPRSKDGAALHTAVQLQLASLSALDGGDWDAWRTGKHISG